MHLLRDGTVNVTMHPPKPTRRLLLFFGSAIERHLDVEVRPEQARQWAAIEFRVKFDLQMLRQINNLVYLPINIPQC